MEATRQQEAQVRGCVLLLPADLFLAAEQEAKRQGMTLEAFILTVLEDQVRSGADEEPM